MRRISLGRGGWSRPTADVGLQPPICPAPMPTGRGFCQSWLNTKTTFLLAVLLHSIWKIFLSWMQIIPMEVCCGQYRLFYLLPGKQSPAAKGWFCLNPCVCGGVIVSDHSQANSFSPKACMEDVAWEKKVLHTHLTKKKLWKKSQHVSQCHITPLSHVA